MPSIFDTVVDTGSRVARARLALEGLSIGDAFGERFFASPSTAQSMIEQRAYPKEPWRWTDDTAMGLSVFEMLRDHGSIEPGSLAKRFAERYRRDPARGYGGTAHTILQAISLGEPWERVSRSAFDGQGSMGNGAAMRAAPIGGYFCDDLEEVVRQARASAEPTHAHADGHAGAIAVAVAAAVAWQMGHAGSASRNPSGQQLFGDVLAHTPSGPTRDGIEAAARLPLTETPRAAVAALGNGSGVISSDTVPFCLWCAARHLDSFEEAMWTTVAGLGDRDTTCAIVGGIVALSVGEAGIPPTFLRAREPLDASPTDPTRPTRPPRA